MAFLMGRRVTNRAARQPGQLQVWSPMQLCYCQRPDTLKVESEKMLLRKTFAGVALAFAFLAGFAASPVCAANLIKDGSFEKPIVASGDLSRFSTGQTIGPWLVTGDNGNVDVFGPGFTFDGCSFNAKAGKQLLDLTGASDSATGVQQVIKTQAGTTYDLSLFVGSINSGCIDGKTSTVNVFVDGAQIASFVYKAKKKGTTSTWKKFSTQFQATQDNTTIAFINGDPPADTYNGIDDVIVKPAQK
jgi:hypothetical protein